MSLESSASHQDWVELYRKFLRIETHRLYMSHRYGAEGLQVAKDRSYLVDVLIRHIFDLAQKELRSEGIEPDPLLAMAALGGYGRRELNPHSDIDLLFLTGKKAAAAQDRTIKHILYLLWDIGFKVGQAVRTVPDAIEEGRRDFKSRTSMMEARFLTGDVAHFEKFRETFQEKCLARDISSYVAQKIDEIRNRHQKYRNTVYLQEPHIKEGAGGLRDLASCLWLYQTVCGHKTFEELLAYGVLNQNEYKILLRVLNFLHRVRNDLHFTADKCFDVLTLALQPRIAKNLGYRDTRVLKMSEAFMKDYYSHARNAYQMTQDLLARDEIQTQLKIHFPSKFVDRHGFSFTEEEILPGRQAGIFSENPHKLFEVFLYCAKGNYRLNRALIQQIRRHLYLVDRKIVMSVKARDLFVALLSDEGPVIGALRAMHDTGLLGKYIPEFSRATCFVQHDFYHKYTLDEHTLKAVEYLDALKTAPDPRLAGFAAVLKEVANRDVLYLATFFHDIGKIEGKDHSIKGARIVQDILRRMQYDAKKILSVKTLVEHHLLMAHLSQRRDLSEEKVIHDFANKIGTVEHLRCLLLLTYADSNATGDEIWNEWKEALLWELYYRTKRYLQEKVVLLPSEIQAIRDACVDHLTRKGIASDAVKAHLDMLPVNYLQSYQPDAIYQHLKILSGMPDPDVKTLWRYHEKTNTTELTVCTRDHIGLFAEITGVIASQDVNILGADIFSRKDGIVLDRFYVQNAPEKAILPERIRDKIDSCLADAILKRRSVQELLRQRASQRQAAPGETRPVLIKFDNESSLATTILEIQADDQIGFLYKVTQTLSKMNVNIHLARITTEKTQIYDVFYITGVKGNKIESSQEQAALSDQIQMSIRSPLEFV